MRKFIVALILAFCFICCKQEDKLIIHVTGVSLSETTATLIEGESIDLIADIIPENATNQNIYWSSSNNSIASVVKGRVTAIKTGTATITARSEDGNKSARCDIVVEELRYDVARISLNRSKLNLMEGESTRLIATIEPWNATNQTVIWSSSDESVASVNNGEVKALRHGVSTIYAYAADNGYYATCIVYVTKHEIPITSIKLDKGVVSITEGQTDTLTTTIYPENATNKTIIWESTDNDIASVEEGIVTAISAGNVTITASTEDRKVQASCIYYITNKEIPVTGVALSQSEMELTEGDIETLTATLFPENATNQNVKWSSSKTSVVSVQNGEITAKKPGTATITVTTEDGGYTASCIITVNAIVYPVTGVALDKTEMYIKKGETAILTASITPSYATNQNISWSSSNSSIARVDNGIVTAIEPGTADITVTTEDGELTARCIVTVREHKITIDDWENDGNDNSGTAE